MKKIGRYLQLTALLFALLTLSCQENPLEPTASALEEMPRPTVESRPDEGEPVQVTRVAPATQTPAAPDLDPIGRQSYRGLTAAEPQNFDPAMAYDTASRGVLEQVMEGLIYYNHKDSNSYVPQLAVEVPSQENDGISADGLTYTFYIRQGIRFHAGGTLEAHDVEYTIERGLLQSQPGGPQRLLLEPLLGYSDVTGEIGGGTFKGNPEALRQQASAEELAAACEKVKAAVEADDESGRVTFHLAQPWAPFLATLAQSWGYVLDSEWVIDQGGWDGSCATWSDHYAPGTDHTELGQTINGTGPYILANWLPGEKVVLVANPNYWRPAELPLWEGGPGGTAAIDTVIIEIVPDWMAQFERFQAGGAEAIDLPLDWDDLWQLDDLVGEECDWRTNECQSEPDQPFRRWINAPVAYRDDLFMAYWVNPDSSYIGSGQFDGSGVPADFFSDIHVRRAFNYCFDHTTYIERVYKGYAGRSYGPLPPDMPGYNPNGLSYDYDLSRCRDELEEAWDGVLPEVGFHLSMLFIKGNDIQQDAGRILQVNLNAISPRYQLNIVSLLEADFQAVWAAGQVPIYAAGWLEEIHDPHNWAESHTLVEQQHLPSALLEQFQAFLDAGVQSLNPGERQQAYFDLQGLYYTEAIQIPLPQPTTLHYEPRYVLNWFSRAGAPAPYYYALSINRDP